MNIPILFIHTGYTQYMEFTLRQVKYTNPYSKIILLGDENNNIFSFLQHENISSYMNEANKFACIYQHFSTNSLQFELFCFQRWFIIKEFMEKNNLDKVFVFDTDIMIYTDIADFTKKNKIFSKYQFGLCVFEDGSVNGCTSFWNLEAITSFCKFLIISYTETAFINRYKNVWMNLQKKNKLGGACDMTALEFFCQTIETNKILKLNGIILDSTFDENINSPNALTSNEYLFKNKIKEINFSDNTPQCYNIKFNKKISFNSLHFQGPAKYKIAKFYTGKTFKNIFFLKAKFKLLDYLSLIYTISPHFLQYLIKKFIA